MSDLVLAHGGTAGLVFEVVFLVVPVVAFSVLAVVSRRKENRGGGHGGDGEPDGEP